MGFWEKLFGSKADTPSSQLRQTITHNTTRYVLNGIEAREVAQKHFPVSYSNPEDVFEAIGDEIAFVMNEYEHSEQERSWAAEGLFEAMKKRRLPKNSQDGLFSRIHPRILQGKPSGRQWDRSDWTAMLKKTEFRKISPLVEYPFDD